MARLLGVRVLRVDGTVRLAPARVVERAPVVVVPDAVTDAVNGAVNGAGPEPPTVVVADASPLGGELARAAEVLRALEIRAPRA